ncbi:MAG: alpha/beta fold hydrolase [Eubacteriales bacterium]|nr:alpha/beta fold hydrolase [Eubacteriales bacterium]
MEKREFNYPSLDRETRIHAIEWIPDGEVKAVVQLVHGMVEFIDRYDRLARFLNENGIYVTGNDHLGHGASVVSDDRHGYFAKKNGNACVIGDLHQLRKLTEKKYPGVPYFILGHSMGSFLTRQYIELHGEGLKGAVICGTQYMSIGMLRTAKALAASIGKVRGDMYRSKLLNDMAIGSFNKNFEPSRTPNDWLTKDEEIVDAYCENPWNNFQFTTNAYYNMFTGMEASLKKENMERIPKDLPLYVIAGGDDPVGDCGKGPRKLAEIYQALGIRDVVCRIYEGDRHEIFNELDHEVVDRELLDWIQERL